MTRKKTSSTALDEATLLSLLGDAPQPLRTSKQDQIRYAIQKYILDHELQPGDTLPSETELCKELGVGRNALREAMKALEAVDIVEIRHGFGTYVGSRNLKVVEDGLTFRSAQSANDDFSELRNILEVREALEAGLSEDLVDAMTDADIDKLEKIVDQMEKKAAKGTLFPELDAKFHSTMYATLDNGLVTELIGVFWRVFTKFDPLLDGPQYTAATAAGWHRSIVNALRHHDATELAQAIRYHFSGIRGRLDSKH
ncbi:MAG: FadR family transcriptional regulator [Bifidobacteriaceae bacterium]|jgi:DNA-binding FadR family transcriptional regulator|nr:FadR family transcriptional regulator [Bifidobacteriaceae bacterium]